MKKCLFALVVMMFFVKGFTKTSDEFLFQKMATNGFTDHIACFNELFILEKPHAFLELGLGDGTQFYLKTCDHVTSIELVIESRKQMVEPWYFKSADNYSCYSNWSPNIHYFSKVVDQANQEKIDQVNQSRLISLRMPSDLPYLSEIKAFIDSLFSRKHFDIVFVDPGIHLRGDLVNELFSRVDIIAAHDTNAKNSAYGWERVNVPENYEMINCSYGSGTTFWIKKEKTKLINELKKALNILELGGYAEVEENNRFWFGY